MLYIKSFLDRTPFLQALARIIYHWNDGPFINFINTINNNPYLALINDKEDASLKTIEELNDEYEEIACMIKVGDANDGFFASVRWALDGLYFCEKIGGVPTVKFTTKSMYADHIVFDNSLNPFEYYFDKIEGNNVHEMPRVIYNSRNKLLAEQMNDGVSYSVTDKYIDEMSKIMRKYLHFNNRVSLYVNALLDNMNFDEKILGVHIRGTDYRMGYKNHPVFLEAEDYYEIINKAVNKYGFKKIFLATDDSNLLDDFIVHYGSEMVIFSKNVERGKSNVGVHIDKSSKKTPYYLGLDVIGDMCALSSCDGIVSGMSQVSLIARIYKKSKGEDFVYDKVISKGINREGELYHNPKVK